MRQPAELPGRRVHRDVARKLPSCGLEAVMSTRIKLDILLGAVVVAAVACNNEIVPPPSQLWASRVRGTIRGPSGQVAANASVTVASLAIDATNAATLGPCSGSSGGTFTTTTDANGRFVVQLLGVGGPSL